MVHKWEVEPKASLVSADWTSSWLRHVVWFKNTGIQVFIRHRRKTMAGLISTTIKVVSHCSDNENDSIKTQRERILLVEWVCAYYVWSNSTYRMCSLCVVIVIVSPISLVWLCLKTSCKVLQKNHSLLTKYFLVDGLSVFDLNGGLLAKCHASWNRGGPAETPCQVVRLQSSAVLQNYDYELFIIYRVKYNVKYSLQVWIKCKNIDSKCAARWKTSEQVDTAQFFTPFVNVYCIEVQSRRSWIWNYQQPSTANHSVGNVGQNGLWTTVCAV